MADAKTLEELSHAEYWDIRYSKQTTEPTYEWFKSYENVKLFFSKHLPAPIDSNGTALCILHLGNGNSTLPLDLLSSGYKDQVCVDFSTVVIQSMTVRYASEKGIKWKVLDVRNMSEFDDGKFSVAVDKGTLDAMISGSPWNPPEEVKNNTGNYVDEVYFVSFDMLSQTADSFLRATATDYYRLLQVARVVKPGGVFLYITYRQPHFMKPMLEREGVWELTVEVLKDGDGSTFDYFGYVMKKSPNQPE